MPQSFWPQYYTSNAYYQTTASTQTQYIWTGWVNQTSNATLITPQNGYYTTVSPNQIWQQWVVMGNQTMSYQPMTYQPIEETTEQRTARRLREEFAHRERTAARTRARALLDGFLTDEQKAELETKGRFHVTGSRGRRYCIRAEGQAGNVDLLKPDGSLQARLCCHPRQGLPDGDAWLMQMIEIRHDEDHFLRTANVHRGALPVAA